MNLEPRSSNAIPEKYLALLACPLCRGEVKQEPNRLVCEACGQAYPVDHGIPDLFPYGAVGPEMRKSIDSWNQEWQKLGLPAEGQTERDPAYLSVLDYIGRHAPAQEPWGVFLEAGCGNGQVALLVARKKKTPVVGIDCCREACKQARRLFDREGEDGFFVVGDLRQMPFKAGALGYIFGWGSLEHFPDTARAMAEAHRVLRPLGRMTHSVPVVSLSTLSYYQLWGNIPDLPILRPLAEWFHMRLLGGRHMRFGYEKSFWPSRLRRLYEQAGFRNIQYGPLGIFMKFERPLWGWLKALARRLARMRLFWPMMFMDGDR